MYSAERRSPKSAKGPSRRELLTGIAAGVAVSAVSGRAEAAQGNSVQPDGNKFLDYTSPQLEDTEDVAKLKAQYEKWLGFEVVSVGRKMQNRFTGESVRMIRGKEGQFKVDYRVEPGGFIPFRHHHESASEVFQLVEGKFTLLVGDEKLHVKAGETQVVPAGVDHEGWNDGWVRARFMVGFEPLGDGDVEFEIYWELCDEGRVNYQTGEPDIVELLQRTAHLKSRTYPAKIPEVLVNAARTLADEVTKDYTLPKSTGLKK